MKRQPLLALALIMLLMPVAGLVAQDSDPLARYAWVKRPLVIFADTPDDPRFQRQMKLLADDPKVLEKRDVVILTDTDPAARSPLRLKLRPRGFMLVLIAKDGKIAFRKPLPRTVREISRAIDKMPMRLDEMKEKRGIRD